MANNSAPTIGGQLGWTEVALRNGPLSLNPLIPPMLASVDSMITALNTADATTYTIPRLLSMTSNDMIFAIRTIYGAGNI
jgi:hypothetical protein